MEDGWTLINSFNYNLFSERLISENFLPYLDSLRVLAPYIGYPNHQFLDLKGSVHLPERR